MKDYDAIARGAQEDDTWSIFSVRYDKDGKPWRFEITGGINGEGPAYTVGVIEGKERADEICAAHNAAILRKHDEAEAGGELEKQLCLEMFGDNPDTHVLQARVEKLIAYRNAIARKPAPTDEKALGVIRDMADQLDRWANESRSGGWSTHQVDPMRRKADELRRFAALAREAPKERT